MGKTGKEGLMNHPCTVVDSVGFGMPEREGRSKDNSLCGDVILWLYWYKIGGK